MLLPEDQEWLSPSFNSIRYAFPAVEPWGATFSNGAWLGLLLKSAYQDYRYFAYVSSWPLGF